ncbi:hypothetical protein pb186bvf_013663 [Paramecium bursaria]
MQQKQVIQFYIHSPLLYGQELYLIGNIEQLGQWDVNNSLHMIAKGVANWELDIEIPYNTNVEYKYLIKEGYNFIWEEGENRKFKTTLHDNKPKIEVMSFNIRFDNPDDGVNNWNNRKLIVKELLQNYKCDFIGLQEVKKSQIQYLQTLVDYGYIGRGRSQGFWDDEATPIFYLINKYRVVESETFWLSDTPQVPNSRSYGNRLPRVCTYSKFISLVNGKVINVYNTHLDHEIKGDQQAKQIKNHINTNAKAGEYILLMGDFNFVPTSPVLNIFKKDGLIQLQTTFGTLDALKTTFHNYSNFMQLLHIDYILISQNLECEDFKILKDNKNGKYPSDHYPIKTVLKFK